MTEGEVDFAERLKQRIGRASRTESVAIRFTEAELATLAGAANAGGDTLREWSREVLLKAARGSVADPTFTELIAMRRLLNSVLRYVACGEIMTASKFNAEMQEIRTTKHKAADEIFQQYAMRETTR